MAILDFFQEFSRTFNKKITKSKKWVSNDLDFSEQHRFLVLLEETTKLLLSMKRQDQHRSEQYDTSFDARHCCFGPQRVSVTGFRKFELSKQFLRLTIVKLTNFYPFGSFLRLE
jgi:hypothetical protein